MKKSFRFSIAMITLIFMLTIFAMPQGKVSAAVSDGTYSVDYQILKAEDDSVSMANDYFEKPATLSVEDGVQYIEFTLNHSEWIKELQAPSGGSFSDVDVISEDKGADKRTVKFKVDEDLSKPLEMKMHVYIDSMDPIYDHRYTVRYDFDIDNMKATGSNETKTDNKSDDASNGEENNSGDATNEDENNSDDATNEEESKSDDVVKGTVNKDDNDSNKGTAEAGSTNGDNNKEDNPPTGDNVPITLFVVLLIGSSLVIYSSWKSGFNRN